MNSDIYKRCESCGWTLDNCVCEEENEESARVMTYVDELAERVRILELQVKALLYVHPNVNDQVFK